MSRQHAKVTKERAYDACTKEGGTALI